MSLIVLGFLFLAATQEDLNPPELWAGEAVFDAISGEDGQATTPALLQGFASMPRRSASYLLFPEDAGPHHVLLHSPFFDAYLVLRDTAGGVLAQDDDGWFGSHALLDLEQLDPGSTYRLDVIALWGVGEYRLELRSGPAPEIDPEECANRCLEDAREALSQLELAREGETVRRAHALSRHGRALIDVGQSVEGNRVAAEAFQQLRRLLDLGYPKRLPEAGRYGEQRRELERSLPVLEKVFGRDHLEVALYVERLGVLLTELGQYQAAIPLFQRVRALREAQLGMDHPDLAMVLSNLAGVVGFTDPEQALALQWESVQVLERAYGPEHPMVADVLSNLANQHSRLGQNQQARPLYERSLQIKDAKLGPDDPTIADTLESLSLLVQHTGNLSEAREILQRALAIREANDEALSIRTARTLTRLASVASDEGKYVEARTLTEKALAIYEVTQGSEGPGVAAQLDNLAVISRGLGDMTRVRTLHERALQIREKAWGPHHPSVALTLTNLAVFFAKAGDDDRALLLLLRAREIYRVHVSGRHEQLSSVLTNLAVVWKRAGELDKARAALQEALAIWRNRNETSHYAVGRCLQGLAQIAYQAKDLEQARDWALQSLQVRRKALPPAHPEIIETLRLLSAFAMAQGDLELAWDRIREAGRTLRFHLESNLYLQSEGESLLYLAKVKTVLDQELDVAQRLGTAAHRDAYELVLEWKGRIARLLQASRRRLRQELSDEQRELLKQLQATQAVLSRLAFQPGELNDLQVDAVRRRRADQERQLRATLPTPRIKPVVLEDVLAQLPPGTAVLDFLIHRGSGTGAWIDSSLSADNSSLRSRLGCWILRQDRRGVAWVELGFSDEIEAAIQLFLNDLVSRRGVSPAGPGPDCNEALREQLWRPLVRHLEGVHTVFVSPDGVLGTLPFEVLQQSNGRFLIEDRSFVYSSDVATFSSAASLASEGRLDTLLCSGGVDFRRRNIVDEPSRPASPPGAQIRGSFATYWGPLPATRYESEVVAAMHQDAFGEEKRRLLVQGRDATEELLKVEMPLFRVVHLATHGFFQPEGLPSMWSLALDQTRHRTGGGATEDQQVMRIRESAQHLLGHHPGLLSGLVCAGANQVGSQHQDDGYLTAEEVGWLDLSKVELVVLSACETGLGRARSGEGLIGLRRAFRTAGARTVISSLWSVKDESTSRLMQSFYANLFLRGLGRCEALRSAQLEMLQRNRMQQDAASPGTWGAFVLDGEWR